MALYHTHRPQQFKDIIGQDHIVKTLSNQVKAGKVAHAYLFSGPRGIGKTTTARILAKAVNCPQVKDNEPCNKCDHCSEISGSRSIDVIEIDAASHTGVDNVRENIIENAQFKPTKSKNKIFIIDEVHMLSTSAFNALLKTLEEPPEHVIFVLATTEPHKLPETIISRCQRFDFKKVPFDIMKKHIQAIAKKEGIKIDKDVVERIINKSDGCVRDAVSLLDQLMASGEKNITAETASLVLPTTNVEKNLEFLTNLINQDMKASLELLNKLVEDGVNIVQFNHDLIELLRIMMVSKANAKTDALGLDLSDKVKKELKKLNEKISPADLVKLIDLFIQRGQQIKSAPLPQLPLEMAVVEYCQEGSGVEQPPLNPPLIKGGTQGKTKEDKDRVETLDNNSTKKTISQRVKKLVTKSPPLSREDVDSKWAEFLRRTEEKHPSLAFILKMAEIIAVEGNILKLAVQYNFHQDKLMDKSCRSKLEEILSELMATKVKLEAEVREAQAKQDKDELKELASSLGGEIIN